MRFYTLAMLTIGQLARRVGLRPSALRYYEAEGLLRPSDRTEAGYRLYAPESADTVRLIQRAQRLGFSLAEIRGLLAAWRSGDLDNAELLATAEARYLALERQVTELRVQQHELELFLQDLRGPDAEAAQTAFGRLVDRICANPSAEPPSHTVLDWLSAYAECPLSGPAANAVLPPCAAATSTSGARTRATTSSSSATTPPWPAPSASWPGWRPIAAPTPATARNWPTATKATCSSPAAPTPSSSLASSWPSKKKPLDFQPHLKAYNQLGITNSERWFRFFIPN